MVGWESAAERDSFYCSEVLPEVVSYRSQPHTIEAIVDGKVRRYTPDVEEILADGRVRITEVKEDFEAARDPDYAAKLQYFGEIYLNLGWAFRVLERRDFAAQPEFAGICKVQAHRRVGFDAHDLAIVRRRLVGGPRPIQELAEAFRTPVIGAAMICAMMVARFVEIDLSGGLVADAAVREVDDHAA